MSVKIRSRKYKNTPILEISGEVTGEDIIVKISGRLKALCKEKSPVIAIDLSEATFIDSHGLGVFVYSWRILEQEDRQLVFLNPQNFIRGMFQGTNLDKIFKVVDSVDQLEQLGKG